MQKPSIYRFQDFAAFLDETLKQWKERDPRFSYRWLARKLGLASHTHLLRIVQGRGLPADDLFHKLCEACELTAEEYVYAKAMLAFSGAKAGAEKAFHLEQLEALRCAEPVTLVKRDEFQLISEWHHIALFEMVNLPSFDPDPVVIARRLGDAVTPASVEASLELLIRIGLLRRTASGAVERAVDAITTTHNVPSTAIRSFHRQLLERAAAAMEGVPQQQRFFFGHTLPFDTATLDEAQALILEFRQRFHKLLASSQGDSVYHLAIQLFPLVQADEPVRNQDPRSPAR